MFIKDITDLEKNSLNILEKLNVDKGGINILSKKMKTFLISISNLNVYGANILKQDALSIGADVAVPKGTVICKTKFVNVVLIGTYRQLETLTKKELIQPFGLKDVANELKKILQSYKQIEYNPTIMGILNLNNDSFYSESRISQNKVLQKVEKMILEGAKILDFGAVSSRPNSNLVSESEEMKRVKSVIDILYKNNIYEQVELSIDSYTSSVIKYALDHGFQIVNDITGLRNNEIAKIVGQFNAKIIIMHMQGTPKTMQKNPIYNDVVKEIYLFFQTQIEKAKNFGINNIILDVGIGFGKTLKHNIELLQHLKTFQTLNYPLLVGVSRKSMIDKIISTPINERLAGTLTLHQKAIENGVSILRVHDVKEHRQMIEILKELHKI